MKLQELPAVADINNAILYGVEDHLGTPKDVYIPFSSIINHSNLVVNSGFWFNDTGYVSGTALSNAEYGHDGTKAGINGCTYNFTQLEIPTEITIIAGTLLTHVEGLNFIKEQDCVLTWEGTAQARVAKNSLTNVFAGAFSDSGLIISGQNVGVGLSIEFSTGTLGKIQLGKGSIASEFNSLDVSLERVRSQRYVQKQVVNLRGYFVGAGHMETTNNFNNMRVPPSLLSELIYSSNILSSAVDFLTSKSFRYIIQANSTGYAYKKEELLMQARLF